MKSFLNLFFGVMLHIGTLAAVCAVYFKLIIRLFSSLVSVIKKLIKREFRYKELTGEENLALMIIVGLLPLFALYAISHEVFDPHESYHHVYYSSSANCQQLCHFS